MANIFKKPEDETEFGNMTPEEQKEYLEKFRESLDKEDEKAIILAAIKTFLPPVLILLGSFYLIARLIFR